MSVNNTKQNTREIGNYGEEIACIYLNKLGYFIQDRNYNRKWGELDIVAVKDNIIHFIEVKSVSLSVCEKWESAEKHRPEENVHRYKVLKIKKMILCYVEEKRQNSEEDFAFHVICVYLNFVSRKAKIKIIENIIL
jgi:putative endonuclease